MGENKKRDPHSLYSVKVGDMVVMSTASRESREVQVTTIGRKYLSAGGYQFDFDGRVSSAYSYPTIETLAKHAQRLRDVEACNELRAMGFDLGWRAPSGWSWSEVRDALAPIAKAKREEHDQ